MRAVLNRLHRLLAGSRLAVWVSLKLRNQCSAVIAYRMAISPDSERNGEHWLLREVGGEVRTFIDVGAHRGRWTSLLLSHAAAEVRGLLFEPNTDCLAELHSRFAKHALLEICPRALGAMPGELPFRCEDGDGERSRIVAGAGAPGDRVVPVSTLDHEMGERSWDRVDVVKVDAEGYDLHVLRGASAALAQGRIGIVQFEYGEHWPRSSSTLIAAVDFLRARGYETFLLTPGGLEPIRYERWGEHFSYSNYLAVSPQWRARAARLIRDAS